MKKALLSLLLLSALGAAAQTPYELKCALGSFPLYPIGVTYDSATLQYRQWLCADNNGNVTATLIGGGGAAVWGAITGTLSSQTDLQSALNLKAPLASPTFTGTVTLPDGSTWASVLTAPNNALISMDGNFGGSHISGFSNANLGGQLVFNFPGSPSGGGQLILYGPTSGITGAASLDAYDGATHGVEVILRSFSGFTTPDGFVVANGWISIESDNGSGVQQGIALFDRATRTSLLFGPLNLQGATSGSATIQVAAAAGNPNPLQLPIATGSASTCLQTDGGSPQQLSWVTCGSGGAVASVFGRTGVVVATSGDYSAAQVTNALDKTATFAANTVYGNPTSGALAPVATNAPVVNTVQALTSASTGSSPPAAPTTGGTAYSETTAPACVANVDMIGGNSGFHDIAVCPNGATAATIVEHAAPGAIVSTSNTAAISTATLCAAAAGACNQAGRYRVDWNFIEGGTACGTPSTGGVTFLLTWTDSNGTAHSAVSLAMDDAGSLVATTATFHFQTTLAAAWASGTFNIDSNGSIIQYATGYTACGVGTGNYTLNATVTRIG